MVSYCRPNMNLWFWTRNCSNGIPVFRSEPPDIVNSMALLGHKQRITTTSSELDNIGETPTRRSVVRWFIMFGCPISCNYVLFGVWRVWSKQGNWKCKPAIMNSASVHRVSAASNNDHRPCRVINIGLVIEGRYSWYGMYSAQRIGANIQDFVEKKVAQVA